MRKVISEPGFWMMVFGVILFALFLFAPDAKCEDLDSGLVYIIETRAVNSDMSIGIGSAAASKSETEKEYLYYVGPAGGPYKLVLVSKVPPSARVKAYVLIRFLGASNGE